MKVMVVDDSKMIRLLVKDFLINLGHEFFEAENGQAALDVVKNVSPDLILLDYNMPVLDGVGFLKEYKVNRKGQVPVIMMTTESAMSKITEVIELGAVEYMMKPFDQLILQGKISQVFG